MTIKNIHTWVDIEVDLDEFEEEDLVEHLEDQGYTVFKSDGSAEDINEMIIEMFCAFKLGRDDRALELAKKIAQDHTGRIL